jgi:RNA-binding protein Musashi
VAFSAAEFRAYFERFGRVVSAEVMFNRETHKSRGFGFIIFELEDSAINSCGDREHVINGKVVRIAIELFNERKFSHYF